MTKIAIIGASIGGSSLAYHLNQFDPDLNLTIFEKRAEVGGRIRSVEMDGLVIDYGASFFHSVNQKIISFILILLILFLQLWNHR